MAQGDFTHKAEGKFRGDSEPIKASLDNIKTSLSAVLTAMREMSNLSDEIRSINDVISGIAFQTHILSLNAAIEAASAGEYGKGFSVVADEVGQLAAKCGESAQKTTALIDRTVSAISNGMKLAETVACSFDSVSKITDEVEQNISEISAASEEQYACIDIVCEKVGVISPRLRTPQFPPTAPRQSAKSL